MLEFLSLCDRRQEQLREVSLIKSEYGCMPTAIFRDKQDESLKRLENFDWEVGDI